MQKLSSQNLQVSSQTSGDLRLVDGAAGVGRLEVFHSSEWGTVCNDNFGYVEAAVACAELGYSSGSVSTDPDPTPGSQACDSQEIWLDDLSCGVAAARLQDCQVVGSVWGAALPYLPRSYTVCFLDKPWWNTVRRSLFTRVQLGSALNLHDHQSDNRITNRQLNLAIGHGSSHQCCIA
jgi:Scavenger receptor cysteine-rich domain